jgi:hypothetical protein
MSDLYLKGSISAEYAFSIVPVYLVALVCQAFTNEMESCLLSVLGIREKNIYSASFLLTEKSTPSNFLEIKDIVSTQGPAIREEIDDFVRIASELKRDNEELAILVNLAKLFIPIKKAYEIHEKLKNEELLEDYEGEWERESREVDRRGLN